MNANHIDSVTKVDILRIAYSVEESKKRKLVYNIDCGNMPSEKMKQYVRDLVSKCEDIGGDIWLPLREGGRTHVEVLPPTGINSQDIIETADKLLDWVINR